MNRKDFVSEMAVAKVKTIFAKHPIISNSVVYGTLYTAAEFSQQTYSRKLKASPTQEYDHKAMARVALFGTTIGANVLYHWYRWLDRAYVGTASATVLKKMLLDQFVLTPPLIATFYTSMSIMEGQRDIFHECKQKIVPTFAASCIFWLPAQAMNFYFVPPPARVVYVGSCAFIWVNVICWFKKQEVHEPKED